MKELIAIQGELEVPKARINNIKGYKYRSCDDILSAAKPLLKKHKCHLVLTDKIIQLGEAVYIEATATLTNETGATICVTSSAREQTRGRDIDASQATGSASSYARKYALSGLFALDDNTDSDSTATPTAPSKVTGAEAKKKLKNGGKAKINML